MHEKREQKRANRKMKRYQEKLNKEKEKLTREEVLKRLHNGESLDRQTCGNIQDLTPYLAQENLRRERQ